MVALIPVLFAIAGALLYGLAANPNVAEIGRLMFACGMLVFLLSVGAHAVKLF